MRPVSFAVMRRLACVGLVLMCCRVDPGVSQSEDCSDLTVSDSDSALNWFSGGTSFTKHDSDGNTRATYLNEDESQIIWYSAVEPMAWTSDTPESNSSQCTGFWVISSSPRGVSFDDLEWYQTTDADPRCATEPTEVEEDVWISVERNNVESTGNRTETSLEIKCDEDEDDGPLVSRRTVIILIIIGGAVFMALMCLGALMCCLRGKNSPEEAIMPPGELTDASIIGSKAGPIKPGLHAHPEVRGAQHPHPEDRASSITSTSRIPQGSRSGPSVRSIGYT